MTRVGMQLLGADAVMDSFRYLLGKLEPPSDWVVGTNVSYSVYVEFGTENMAAQPYLRPAVEKAKRNLGRIVEQSENLNAALRSIALLIESEAKRLAPVDTGTLQGSIKAVKV